MPPQQLTAQEKDTALQLLQDLLSNGLPPAPTNPALAERQRAKIQLVNRYIEEHVQLLLRKREGQLLHVISGDDLQDAHHREVERKERERQAAITRGEDPHSLAVKNWQAEAEESRRRDAERAAQNKARQAAEFERIERMNRQAPILR